MLSINIKKYLRFIYSNNHSLHALVCTSSQVKAWRGYCHFIRDLDRLQFCFEHLRQSYPLVQVTYVKIKVNLKEIAIVFKLFFLFVYMEEIHIQNLKKIYSVEHIFSVCSLPLPPKIFKICLRSNLL